MEREEGIADGEKGLVGFHLYGGPEGSHMQIKNVAAN